MGICLRPLSSNRPDDYVDKLDYKLIINDVGNDVVGQEEVRSHLYVELQGDIGLRPTCGCGYTVITAGSYGDAEPCVKCKTTPKLTMDKALEYTLFLRKPPATAPLMFPQFLSVLMDAIPMGSFNVIEYLLNRRYRTPRTINASARNLIVQLKENGIRRGYNFFVENADRIIRFLCQYKGLKDPDIIRYWEEYQTLAFTNHVAFMSNLLFIMEKSQGSRYYDQTFRKISDAVISMVGVDEKPAHTQEDLVGKCLTTITDFYDKHFNTMYNSRKGIMRQVLYAGKGISAMRCVMSALTTECSYDELHLPWAPTVQALSTHIVSKLLKRQYRLNDAHALIQRACHAYDPTVDEILHELMYETSDRGFVCFIERFPILGAGSMMLMYGTTIKKVVSDKSISFPAYSVRSSNLDFDGDEMHLQFVDDKRTFELLKPLELHNVALDRLRPDTVSRNVEITKPVFSNLCRYLESADSLMATQAEEKEMYDLLG